jgi:hypothetical protein
VISIPCYVTREEVKGALDVVETARVNDRIDSACEAATQGVDALLRRSFSPWLGTRYFSWPDTAYRTPWRLWLDDREVIEVTSIFSGGIEIPGGNYFLEPDTGPPFSSVEVDQSTSSAFQAGDTRQRAIAITGTFGFTDQAEGVGELAGNLAASQGAAASVTWTTSKVGVGSLLRIDDERVLVTDRSMVSSGQTLQTPLTASTSNVAVAVQDGSAFGIDEIVLLDSERMRIVDISGNTLSVRRAQDGSVLATHSGSTIYAYTGVSLLRAVQGSELAAHTTGDTITRHIVPPLVKKLALAYALNFFLQESSGYARLVGTGEMAQEASGRSIRSLEQDAESAFGRMLQGAI